MKHYQPPLPMAYRATAVNQYDTTYSILLQHAIDALTPPRPPSAFWFHPRATETEVPTPPRPRLPPPSPELTFATATPNAGTHSFARECPGQCRYRYYRFFSRLETNTKVHLVPGTALSETATRARYTTAKTATHSSCSLCPSRAYTSGLHLCVKTERRLLFFGQNRMFVPCTSKLPQLAKKTSKKSSISQTDFSCYCSF